MNCLVLGGNGFIGSYVVDELIANNCRVMTYGSGVCRNPELVEHVTADFLDSVTLGSALQSKDVVVHSISSTVPATAAKEPCWDIESNLIGTIKLVQEMAKQQVSRLVYLSSGGTVYGNPDTNPVNETDRLNPLSTYGATKVAIEHHISILCKQNDIELVIIRPSNPYGVRQGIKGGQGLISTGLKAVIQNQPFTIFGDGSTIRDYLYVSDLASLIASAATHKPTGIYNAGYGSGQTVNDVLAAIEDVTMTNIKRVYSPIRQFDVSEIVLNASKAKLDFKWQCNVKLKDGILRQYNWLRENINGSAG